MSPTLRFWAKVAFDNDCWTWTGGFFGSGYGCFWLGGSYVGAHVAAWRLFRGPIAGGLQILHKCDNPRCVRPAHLFLGDQVANMRDATAKGRRALGNRGRQTHCKRGHPLDGPDADVRRTRDGERVCRRCYREWYAARRHSNVANHEARP